MILPRRPHASALVVGLSALAAVFAEPVPVFAQQGEGAAGGAYEQTDAPPDGSTDPLELAEIWRSVDAHHPRIRAAIARVRKAEGEHMAARGGFDPRLEAKGNVRTGGYYELRRLDVELVQPTPLWGTEVYTGYRLGLGVEERRYPSYQSDDTLASGEIRAGVRVPLWRDGPIDGRRAARSRASLMREAVGAALDGSRLELRVAAARVYWDWVAAGQVVQVAQSMVELAETRQQQLERRFQRGAVAEVDVLDNERALLDRRGTLVSARRRLAGAAFDLALYLRNAQGAPVRPSEDQVPRQVQPPGFDTLDVSALSSKLYACHPDVRRRKAKIEAAEVAERLAENRVAPEVNTQFEVSRDFGDPERDRTLPGTEFKAGLSFAMPLPLRTERGRSAAASARVQALENELDWLRDRLWAQVGDLAAAVEAARKRLEVEKKQWRIAQRLAEAERRRFELGSSSLRVVNLREQTAAEAELKYRKAAAASRRAWARWRVFQSVDCTTTQ